MCLLLFALLHLALYPLCPFMLQQMARFFKKIYLFIYFLPVVTLHCCTWAFSSFGSKTLLRCTSFSFPWLLLLQSMFKGFSSYGTWAQLLQSMWDLLGPEMERCPLHYKMILNHWTTREAQDFVLIYGSIHMPYVHTCTPHLIYPFIYCWTIRLLPYLGCCEWCCSEHSGA